MSSYRVCALPCQTQPEHLKDQKTTPGKRTIKSTIYKNIEMEADAQGLTETIHPNDDSSDEYQNTRRSEHTESDTKPET